MVTLNTNLRKESLDRFGIPEPYIRRCVVADTEYVETELRNVDLVAKEIFELKDFPRISLKRLQLKRAKLTDGEFNSLRNLLLACVNDEFQRLVDTRPLVILALGRSALLAGDLQESIYQTLWDRLICLESLGVVLPAGGNWLVKNGIIINSRNSLRLKSSWSKLRRKSTSGNPSSKREKKRYTKDQLSR